MAYMTGKDVLIKPDGTTYHLGTKKGDVHPRILTVGSASRAERIAKLLDQGSPVKEMHSARDMHTYSGTYKGVGVSVISIGMGSPMMDFMVREAAQCLDGPMCVIRFGTCGIWNKNINTGTMMTAGKGAVFANINYAHYTGCCNDSKTDYKNTPPYILNKPFPCSKSVNEELMKQLKECGCAVHDGMNGCGLTFYSCQGRKDPNFKDENETLVDEYLKAGVDFVDMETHELFFLQDRSVAPLYTAACCVGILNRFNDTMPNIGEDQLHKMETQAGKACLETLVKTTL